MTALLLCRSQIIKQQKMPGGLQQRATKNIDYARRVFTLMKAGASADGTGRGRNESSVCSNNIHFLEKCVRLIRMLKKSCNLQSKTQSTTAKVDYVMNWRSRAVQRRQVWELIEMNVTILVSSFSILIGLRFKILCNSLYHRVVLQLCVETSLSSLVRTKRGR